MFGGKCEELALFPVDLQEFNIFGDEEQPSRSVGEHCEEISESLDSRFSLSECCGAPWEFKLVDLGERRRGSGGMWVCGPSSGDGAGVMVGDIESDDE